MSMPSGPYMFGARNSDKPTPPAERKRLAAIAKRHGAEFIEIRDANRTYRRWFTCKNLGEPFDSAVARAVLADVAKLGL